MLQRIKRNEKAAVEVLIGRFRYLIIKCGKYENDREKRKDLESIMIIATIEAAKHFQGPDFATFPGYLMKWLMNVTSNYIRKECRLRAREGALLNDSFHAENSFNDTVVSIANMDMLRAMQLLGREEKELVVLHLVYDYTWHEISVKLKTNKATLYSRYKKALLKMRVYYKDEYKHKLRIAEFRAKYKE